MRNPFQTGFAAVFTNEVLLNTKRVAPYLLMVLFSANAVLWWGRGPAVGLGWATNSDFYIQRNTSAFSLILGLPIFTGLMIGDVVIRDLRLNVDPLIFSKPIGRGSYLLGKFFGNFFVLVCCQSAFSITYCLLQWVPFSGMVTLPVRIVPYFKHFFFLVVISHLGLAAIYFLAGTLTRNAKVVYVLAACFYPVFISQALLVSNLPTPVRQFFGHFGLDSAVSNPWNLSPDFLNQFVVSYSLIAWANRVSVVLVTALCLSIVYLRFSIQPRTKQSDHFTTLTLLDAQQTIIYSDPTPVLIDLPVEARPLGDRIAIPEVTSARGPAATLSKLIAAVGVEFRLLRAERGLIVLLPLAVILSFFSVPFSKIPVEISYSVTNATNTANMLLLFLACVIVFYTGEVMHRDRELRIEPIVWSVPAPNSVLLISKFVTLTLLALSAVVAGGLTTIVTQLLRGQTPVDFSAYFLINGIVVVPGVIFLTAVVIALNALLRNKYVTYVVAVGTGAALIYLYSLGYNHWLYNPLLNRLWTYGSLTTPTTLVHRLYCLFLAALFLFLAHLFFARKSR